MRTAKSNDKELNLLRCLLHADTGKGKTTSIKTLPVKSTYIAVGERGLVPLRNESYDVGILDCWGDMRELITKFRKPVTESNGLVKVLVLDSLTTCSDFCVRDILATARPQIMKARGKDKEDAKNYEEQMTMEDWGLYRTRLNNFVAALCHLPIHVVVMSLSDYRENKKTGETRKTAALSGKAAFEVPSQFDLVMHMEDIPAGDGKGTVRAWRTFNDDTIVAKDASGVLAPFEKPDWTSVFVKILGKKKSSKEKTDAGAK